MSFPFCRGVDRGMGSVFMEPGMLVEPTVSPGCPAFRVLVAQLCPIPSNPIDHSLPGSSVCGILQAENQSFSCASHSTHLREGLGCYLLPSISFSISPYFLKFSCNAMIQMGDLVLTGLPEANSRLGAGRE